MRWLDAINGHESQSEKMLEDSEGQGSLCTAVHGISKRWT